MAQIIDCFPVQGEAWRVLAPAVSFDDVGGGESSSEKNTAERETNGVMRDEDGLSLSRHTRQQRAATWWRL
jgi:hypothetical protein